MKDLEEKIVAGEPLMQQAMDALRRYNEAKGHASPEEVERLGFEAVALMEAVQRYQRQALDVPTEKPN